MPMVLAAAASVVGAIASAASVATTSIALTLGASLATAATIGAVTVAVVPTLLGIGASLAFSALTAPPKVGVTAAGTQVDWQADPTAPVPYLIGRTGTAGTIVLRTVNGDHNKYLHTSTVLSGAGPVKSVGSFTADTNAVAFTADGGEGATGTYANRMWWKARLGNHDGQAQAWSATAGAHVPATHGGTPLPIAEGKMSGLAATLWALEYDAKIYPTGVPKPLQVVEGVTAYDPRLDDTRAGGSGGQRADNEASWTYSENPALHALTWCLGRRENDKATFGLGAPADAIDIAAFTEAANVADAHGWKVGGVVYSTDGKRDVLRAMLEAGSARPIPLGAKISCVVDAPRVSLATLTGVDVVGDVSIAAIKPARSAPNTVWPRYREEAQGWQMVPTAAPVAVTAYYENDRGPRSQEYEWRLVQSADQVATLARYRIENGREFGPVTLPCKPRWMGYRPGDCITVDEPEYGLNGQKCLILGRQVDPASMVCTLTLQSETDGKHAFALGETADPPPLPGLTGVDTLTMPAPGVGAWAIADNKVENDAGVIVPAIVVTGGVDNPRAEAVILDHKPADAGEDAWVSEEWPASATRLVSTSVAAATTYDVAVRYRSILKVENPDEALDLGEVTTADLIASGSGKLQGKSVQQLIDDARTDLAVKLGLLTALQGEADDAVEHAKAVIAAAGVTLASVDTLGRATAAAQLELVARGVDAKDAGILQDFLSRSPTTGERTNVTIDRHTTELDDHTVTFSLQGRKTSDGKAFIFDFDSSLVTSGLSVNEHVEQASAKSAAGALSEVARTYTTKAAQDFALASLSDTLTTAYQSYTNASASSLTEAFSTQNLAVVHRAEELEATVNGTPGHPGITARLADTEDVISNDDGTGIAQRLRVTEVDLHGDGTPEHPGALARVATTEIALFNPDGTGVTQELHEVRTHIYGPDGPGSDGGVDALVASNATALANLQGQAYASFSFSAVADGLGGMKAAGLRAFAASGDIVTASLLELQADTTIFTASGGHKAQFIFDTVAGIFMADNIMVSHLTADSVTTTNLTVNSVSGTKIVNGAVSASGVAVQTFSTSLAYGAGSYAGETAGVAFSVYDSFDADFLVRLYNGNTYATSAVQASIAYNVYRNVGASATLVESGTFKVWPGPYTADYPIRTLDTPGSTGSSVIYSLVLYIDDASSAATGPVTLQRTRSIYRALRK